jgi:hypothetical protein
VKAYLLHPDRAFDFSAAPRPGDDHLVRDLELATLLGAMAAGDKFLHEICHKVLLAGLADPEAIRYRQRILADAIAEPDLVRDLYALAVGALADKRSVWGFLRSQNPSSVLSSAVSQLEVLIARLRQLRQMADQHGARVRSDGLSALFRTVQQDLDDAYFDTLSRHLRQLRFRDGELMSAQLAPDNSGINYVLRSGSPRRRWRERIGIDPPSAHSFTIPPRDDAAAQELTDITSRGINLVANAAAQSADHVAGYFTMLRAELGFYVGCLNLHDKLTARAQPVSFPEPAPWQERELACTDLRDACLALNTEPVVGNDVEATGKRLVIITGANSGGKSTFLRSVGLAQLMMQCGMYVAARAFRASVSQGIFTHFIREEDPEMVSGRLDEELARMSAIADQITPRSLILFNESFAATNEREGSEIGRQVVTALLDADIRVLFVTHHFDLADGFYRQGPDLARFLRAPRQPDGRRDFKLVEGRPLPTSYGQDIYYRIGGWLGERDRSEMPAVHEADDRDDGQDQTMSGDSEGAA